MDGTDLVEKSSRTCQEFNYIHPAYIARNTDSVILAHIVLLVQLQITEKRTSWRTPKLKRMESGVKVYRSININLLFENLSFVIRH
jgi:hypothetical protein